MSPTVDELYRQLIVPKRQEEAERAFQRSEKEKYQGKQKRAVIVHLDCKENGHISKGDWCVNITATGHILSKCGRCNQGYTIYNPPQ